MDQLPMGVLLNKGLVIHTLEAAMDTGSMNKRKALETSLSVESRVTVTRHEYILARCRITATKARFVLSMTETMISHELKA